MNIDSQMIHDEGNLYHRDLIVTEGSGEFIKHMFEFEIQFIRSGNFFIYKIEEMVVCYSERIYRNIAQKYRFYCVRLGQPQIVLRDTTREALKKMRNGLF